MAHRRFGDILYGVAHENRNVKELVGFMERRCEKDISVSSVQAWLNPNRRDTNLPAIFLPYLIEFFDDNRPLEFLCAERGLVAVACTTPESNSTEIDWFRRSAKLAKESADAVAALIEAAVDNELTKDERERCKREAYEAAQAAMAIYQALKEA